MAAKKSNVKAASVLSFERKLSPSEGTMWGSTWEGRLKDAQPLSIQEKSIKGTISNRLKGASLNDPLKLNAEVSKANLQRVDFCALNEDQDTVGLRFTLKIQGKIEQPSICNDTLYMELLQTAICGYKEDHKFNELSRRYAIAIASASFFWRNRVGASCVEVHVTYGDNDTLVFDATEYCGRFDCSDDKIKALASIIQKSLAGDIDHALLSIRAFSRIGSGQEVFPSQELILDKSNSKIRKRKVLHQIGGKAAMHSQKIGNALRTIDTWYDDFKDTQTAISIESYGTVVTWGKAFRGPKSKKDFYSLFDRFVLHNDETLSDDEQHYVMAMLIRGGIFGASGKGE